MTNHDPAPALLSQLRAGLSQPALDGLAACERACRERGLPLYLVGGAVRDLLLGAVSVDLDLAVEGDAEPVAVQVSQETGGRAVTHARFATASVSGRGFRLDLARTRRETYAHPGALPLVEPATLAEDLARRDFTINAIVLRLAPEPAVLVDPYRGIPDVRSRLVRVLHEASFQDDATRMLRAARYAARLGFKIASQTESLIRRDLASLGTISGPRLRRELALQLQEPTAVDGVLLAQGLGVLQGIHPVLRVDNGVAERWRRALSGAHQGRTDELGFCVVANPTGEGDVASISRWLHLAGRFETVLSDLVRVRSLSPELARTARPSQATDLLDGLAPAAVWALSVLDTGKAGDVCETYLRLWRHVKPDLTGDDLLAMGMAPGPFLGETLRRLRAGRLDGEIATRDQECDLVRRALS